MKTFFSLKLFLKGLDRAIQIKMQYGSFLFTCECFKTLKPFLLAEFDNFIYFKHCSCSFHVCQNLPRKEMKPNRTPIKKKMPIHQEEKVSL